MSKQSVHADVAEWNEKRTRAKIVGVADNLRRLSMSGGSTNLTRVEERLGFRNPDDEDHGADVWPIHEWPLVPEGETADTWDPSDAEEVETCNTVGSGCLAPAGYMGAGGGIVRGTVAADGECSLCGEPLCSECADSEGRCIMCTDEDEDEEGW